MVKVKKSKVKPKTRKALAKRLRLTKSGLVKRRKVGLGHLCSHKSGNRKRRLRKPAMVTGSTARRYVLLLAPGR